MTTPRQPSIAIVGAGPGGLSTAMLLAARGLDVTIYESQPEIGGRTGRLTLQGDDGGTFHFDRGPTFFLMPYVLDEIYAAAGRRLAEEVRLTRLDPMYRLIIGQTAQHGGAAEPIRLDCTQDVPEMARRLGVLDPRDGAAFERFIADNREKLRLMEPILRAPIRGVADLINAGSVRFLPHLHPLTSVHGLLSKYFRHPATRLAVSFQSKYLGMSPYECPSLFTILPFIEYEYGIWHPEGGCNAVMRSMARIVEQMGVRIECGSAVQQIEFDGRRARGVVVNGERRRHDHVVINADAAWALKRLVPERLRGADTDAAIDAKRYSCSTFMLYLGLEGPVDLPHHTIYISERYKENLDNISLHGRLSEDPSVYVCNPCVTDPGLAPQGGSALYVLMPTPNTKCSVNWEGATARLEEDTLRQLERRFGIRDVRRRIRAKRVFTPNDWRGMNINFGATFNLAHNLGQMLHRRPPHRLRTVDGVWLVGGGTHPGSGLPVIFLSSQITARLLCEEIGVPAPAPHATHPHQPDVTALEPAGVTG